MSGQPVFIEGNIFSMQIPIPQKVNEGAIEGATKALAAKLVKLIQIIADNQG